MNNVPQHVAIIPDGNRRWGKKQGIAEYQAYLEGSKRMVEVVQYCLENNIPHLSAYALSRDNLNKRSQIELMAVHKAANYCSEMVLKKTGVKIEFFGNVDELESKLGEKLLPNRSDVAQPRLTFHIGVNYSGLYDQTSEVPKVDLLIRTGGQFRLSNFLPIQNADAELLFLPIMWPEFTKDDWNKALEWYAAQNKNLGK